MRKNQDGVLIRSPSNVCTRRFLWSLRVVSWARSVSSSSFSISLLVKTVDNTYVICSSSSSPTVLLTLWRLSSAFSILSKRAFCFFNSCYRLGILIEVLPPVAFQQTRRNCVKIETHFFRLPFGWPLGLVYLSVAGTMTFRPAWPVCSRRWNELHPKLQW